MVSGRRLHDSSLNNATRATNRIMTILYFRYEANTPKVACEERVVLIGLRVMGSRHMFELHDDSMLKSTQGELGKRKAICPSNTNININSILIA